MKGRYISLTPSKEIVQTWALQSPTWPTGKIFTDFPESAPEVASRT